MGIVLRKEKGMPLTSEDMDGNFQELLDRIIALEETPTMGEGIAQVIEDHGEVQLIGSYGSHLGAFKLIPGNAPLEIYKEILPENAKEGQLAILAEGEDITLAFYAGKAWRFLKNGGEIPCKE